MDSTKKLMTGLFVSGTLLLFAIGLFLIGNSTQLFTKSFTAHTDFAKVTGLQIGTKVRVAGMDAGAITVIEVPANPSGKFRVRFRSVESLHPIVRQDSVARIETDGLLGNKFLEINPGSDQSVALANGSIIPSKEPFDWGDLMDQVSETVKTVSGLTAGIKDEVLNAVAQVSSAAKSANQIIKESAPHVKSIIASSDKISADIREIADGISQGRGAMGALFKDEVLAQDVKQTVSDTKKTVQSLRDTTDSAKRIIAKVDDSEIVPKVQKAVINLQQITQRIKDAVDKFESASGEGGVGENLQRTLADAHEAMADLSDNTEALKHNFLFRGFFKQRGFYDLTSIREVEYKDSKFAKGFQQHKLWLDAADLFGKDTKGLELLSAAGKQKLDEAMVEILKYPRNGPLMIEGYATEGDAPQQHLVSRRRAARVQSYIIDRFHLRPTYVGIVPMGAVTPGQQIAGQTLEGVRIVTYYK